MQHTKAAPHCVGPLRATVTTNAAERFGAWLWLWKSEKTCKMSSARKHRDFRMSFQSAGRYWRGQKTSDCFWGSSSKLSSVFLMLRVDQNQDSSSSLMKRAPWKMLSLPVFAFPGQASLTSIIFFVILGSKPVYVDIVLALILIWWFLLMLLVRKFKEYLRFSASVHWCRPVSLSSLSYLHLGSSIRGSGNDETTCKMLWWKMLARSEYFIILTTFSSW